MAQADTAYSPRLTPSTTAPRRDPVSVLASSTFSAGIGLLPSGLREDAHRLYCMLRTLDDLVDEEHSQAAERVDAVEGWAREEEVDTPETRTLTELVRRYPLPRHALIDFCSGMRHDLTRTAIETEDDLRTYCYRVGGTVGNMLAALFGTSHHEGEGKMSTLGMAMQWTNILRDIDEDAAHGRIYIPRSTIEHFGYPTPGARRELLADQIARADELYEEGLKAIPLLLSGRRAMSISVALYREILRQIERDGYGRTPGCAVVPAWRRSELITRHL